MIKILPEFIANQIAAGEVVQRPESVIKELVENSLDANADTVGVFIKNAGKTLIHIVDNGNGMAKEDLELAPLRHSTSKIVTVEDLEEIRTFGFRGEALASISSVSLLEIRTRRQNDKHGWKLISEPQKEFLVEPDNIEAGTQVLVKNLFYNVPARRKFLKANTTEFKYIQETMYKLALAYPEKRFTFYADNQLIFDVQPETLEERIIALVAGGNAEDRLLKVEATYDKIRIYGYVEQPQFATVTNSAQYFFLNKRSIISKNLNYAVSSAFENLFNKKPKPMFVLHIELDYKSVDVNVHPQKSEVKFEDERLIFTCVKKAVFDALKLHNLVPEFTTEKSIYEPVNYTDAGGKQNTIIVDKITGEIINERKLINAASNFQNISKNISESSKNYFPDKASYSPFSKAAIDSLYGNTNELSENKPEFFSKKNIETEELTASNLWQFHSKYIFMQTSEGMLAIDQHNAHERIIYERLIKKNSENQTDRQNLLFPIELHLNNMQFAALKDIENDLQQVGFGFDLSPKKAVITSKPNSLEIDSVEQIFLEIIESYVANEDINHTGRQDKLLATIACKAAIKAGNKLSFEAMKKLVTGLFNCQLPYTCPHGRAIVIEYSLLDFDKKFGRI